MKKIENIQLNKYIYCKTESKEYNLFHIFKPINILEDNKYETIYNCEKYYLYILSKSSDKHCFFYEKQNKIDFNKIDKIDFYNMSEQEFVDTYISFKENDNKYPNQLPVKLIKNI